MTSYFDDKHERLHAAEGAFHRTGDHAAFAKALDEIDTEVVHGVTICSEMPGFPEDLRDRLHLIVLKHSVASLPVNCLIPGYESEEDHARGIHRLVLDLHTLFHDVARRQLDRFSDDPLTPLRCLYASGEGRREALVSGERQVGSAAPAGDVEGKMEDHHEASRAK